jgi:nitronate monooxygenase
MTTSLSLHPALRTPLVDILGCEYPILLAGMGGVSRHELAAAVSNAGGFGCMGMVREPSALIRREVEAYRQLSSRPFAINIIPASTDPAVLKEQVATCLSLKVPAIELFWDVDKPLVRHLKAEGVLVLHQVGTRQAAEDAIQAGADVIIVQGIEAGGHIHGLTSLFGLLPEVVAISPVPVVASGGIASGQALVAALALGAQGVNIGTAFLATHESYAHLHHKERIVKAQADDTVFSHQFFRNWTIPAAVRVLENAVTRGDYQKEYETRQTPVIAQQDGGSVYLFATDSPLRDGVGQLDDMPIYAGQSCGQVHDIVSAKERLHQMLDQANTCLKQLTTTP